VSAQVVTQQQLIPGRQGTGLDNMQMVRPGAGRAAAVQKPARHPGVVKPIPQQVQVTLSRADPVQITGRSSSLSPKLCTNPAPPVGVAPYFRAFKTASGRDGGAGRGLFPPEMGHALPTLLTCGGGVSDSR
jgi:hypothetical protein